MKIAQNVSFYGVGIGNGRVSGRVRFFRRKNVEVTRQSGKRSETAERERLQNAMRKTEEELDILFARVKADVGEAEAEIFEIHAMLLRDEDLLETIDFFLRNGASAESALEHAVEKYSDMLRALNDEYLSARASDLQDIAAQVLGHLADKEEVERAENESTPFLLVADDLTPSETVLLDKSKILGFVTFWGSPNSHTAILARAMGIPALIGTGEIPLKEDGAFALLDAAEGRLILSPSEEQCRLFESKRQEEDALAKEHERYLRSLINKPAITRGGHRMLIYANVADVGEAQAALLNGAEGIGLFRSEMFYLGARDYPTEQALYQSYLNIISLMQGKRVIIRTLDIGADKQISYFNLPKEENPALGLRGVRLCLARTDLFCTQLRAILRASAHGSVSVMMPMIVSAEEVRHCRRLLEECKAELRQKKIDFDERMEMGIMIETPAAALMSEEIAREVDFFSVGTNDLTQHTLAADRQNPAVASICEENREPVMRLIEMATHAIHAQGGWIGICGELAADLHYTQRFVDMKIDELSVSAPYLLGVREMVSECK